MQLSTNVLHLLTSALLATLAISCTGGLMEGGSAPNATPVASTSVESAPVPVVVYGMRHLLKREVLASYQALVGSTPSVDANQLIGDTSFNVFDNDVSQQSISADRLTGLMVVAAQAANDAVANPNASALFGCPIAQLDASCMQQFVASFGKRAYRRPLLPEEVQSFMAMFAAEAKPEDGARLVVRTMLAAPDFFLQPELGTGVSPKAGYLKLTGYEVATRLSLLLTGAGPSDALLASAEQGVLDTPLGVAQAANVMLATPAGKLYLRNFAINWLGVYDAIAVTKASVTLPNDTPQAHLDMAEEQLRLFDDFAAPGQSLLGLYSAPYTYVSTSLAPIYGVPAPPAGQWQKISLQGMPRQGLLTQPNVMAVTNVGRSPSILRGKYVRERLLCEALPSPPPGVPVLMGTDGGFTGSERQRLASHLSNAACNSCHKVIDLVGFGFEQYDGVGNYSLADSSGAALTGQGELVGPTDFNFTGVVDLENHLAALPEAQRCVAIKLGEYLLGHVPDASDAGTVEAIQTQLLSQDLISTILAFVASDAFLYRKAP